ncbi:hypothetical protein CPT_Seuss99 [Caulobacter phage Seuss]|uniref:Uncharacterized protein n=1 Tax=Caulobacter phage Seuss TaxID=1675601 RepID=A0A0K1LNB0_9CAUD|nr:hypothetical protein HOR08_gp099 [Caulobacter phage Seuss]AKU43625.1 hypothetical protein CPT_Seuss99 [Caulobacter phage Seuss]
MLKRVLRRDRDGLFLEWNTDAASRWVADPLDATNITLYENEADVKGSLYNKPGYTLVEFRLSATPTGLTCKDYYKDGVFQERKTSAKRLFVTLTDDTGHGPIAQVELDVALWDDQRYAGEVRFDVLRTASPTRLNIGALKDGVPTYSIPINGWDFFYPGVWPVHGESITLANGFGLSGV